MKIWINDQELTEFSPAQEPLGTVLGDIQNRFVADDSVIAEVWIDDEPLTADRLTIWKDRPIDQFHEVRVVAPARTELAGKGIRLVARGLDESVPLRDQLTDLMTKGEAAQAMSLLNQYVTTWSSVPQTIDSVCRLLQTTPEAFHPELKLSEQLTRLSEQLISLKKALQDQDLVLVSDIINYEFDELTTMWVDVLTTIADDIDPLS